MTRIFSSVVQNTQYIPATAAHGIIVFSAISQEIKRTSFYGNRLADDTLLVMDQGATIEPGNTYTLPAHTQKEGSQGNLPADSIDGYYIIYGID